MRKQFSIFAKIVVLLVNFMAYSQENRPIKGNLVDFKQTVNDTINKSTKQRTKLLPNDKAKIDQYLIISHARDTTHVDTTLTIHKYYKYNYLRKDNFELLPFSNIGQTYTTLSHDFTQDGTKPQFGARARHFNFLEIEDIKYYRVPTPLTELFYKSAFEQGQLLDALFTINLNQNLNLFIGYKGLRSLGRYQNILTSTGNFRFGTNFSTMNKRYNVIAHVVTQDLLNNENGGLTDEDILNFRSGDEEFKDRSVFEPNFENAENILFGKRFYLDQKFQINKNADSLQTNKLIIGNTIAFEDKKYRYTQANSEMEFFGPAFTNAIRDVVTLEDFMVRGYVHFENETLGGLRFNIDYNDLNYGYDNILSLNGNVITNRIKDNYISLGGNYTNTIGKFKVNGGLLANLSDTFKGYNLNLKTSYLTNSDLELMGRVAISNSRPNYNYLLYQSDYISYNWDNSETFNNEDKKSIEVKIATKKYGSISLDYTTISNYTYFRQDSSNITLPFQSSEAVNYFRVRATKEFSIGNFALDNTVMYQRVLSGSDVLNVPDLISRNTLYYRNHLFDKALYLQTGVSFNIFSKFLMDTYNPLLAEFAVQNETSIGAFPRLDFFVNAKVRQTRIFIIAEHFNASFTGYDYFSAPNHPYRDFSIRFGLVWNFFL